MHDLDQHDFTIQNQLTRILSLMKKMISFGTASSAPKHIHLANIMLLTEIGEAIQCMYKFNHREASAVMSCIKSDPGLCTFFNCTERLRIELGHSRKLTLASADRLIIKNCIDVLPTLIIPFKELHSLLLSELQPAPSELLSSSTLYH